MSDDSVPNADSSREVRIAQDLLKRASIGMGVLNGECKPVDIDGLVSQIDSASICLRYAHPDYELTESELDTLQNLIEEHNDDGTPIEL